MPFTKENAKLRRAKAGPRTQSKVNRLVKDVFAEVFSKMQEDPATSLETWAKENQKEFNILVTKLIPVQLDHAGEVINRIIIEDNSNCNPLPTEESDNTL